MLSSWSRALASKTAAYDELQTKQNDLQTEHNEARRDN